MSRGPDRSDRVPHERVSTVVAHALRHKPRRYGLALDDAGWVFVPDLLDALNDRGGAWTTIRREDLEAMVAASARQRYELDGDRIRARYGHSVPGRLAKDPAPPPAVLFHGTSPGAVEAIRELGLVPMRRQYVHLSAGVGTALQVGRRKAVRPVVLQIDAARAAAEGVCFYRGNQQVWLADQVPARFLKVHPGELGRAAEPGR